MERSDKQRKPVAVKNLAELKRFIQPGVEFKTLSQKNHPDLVGLTRVVTTVQTVCFYSKIKDQPNSRFSTDNGGKGFRTDFAKADAYIFDGTTVKVKDLLYMERNIDARRKQAKNKRSIHMLALIHICREPDSSFHFAAEMYIA